MLACQFLDLELQGGVIVGERIVGLLEVRVSLFKPLVLVGEAAVDIYRQRYRTGRLRRIRKLSPLGRQGS